eukprot:s598_g18.t1
MRRLLADHMGMSQCKAFYGTGLKLLKAGCSDGSGTFAGERDRCSHHFTHSLQNRSVSEQYPAADLAQGLRENARKAVELDEMQMEGKAGDVIVMDGRLLHRGQANNLAGSVRSLAYLSYCRPWYYEWPRSQSEERFLFGGEREERIIKGNKITEAYVWNVEPKCPPDILAQE